ncbi:protein SPATA45 homolog [Strongylocentrotus purpuratus]|uniref:Uncharacterized protein n=1 Tax=Strongylocentrotus purpuratus TaxID=7668 RepID=A0A7M7RHE9_STRPU|nr:protein SPATA45 homolog [Strongylocentrotus purpuratus]8SNB_9T Chain 9T, SPATA45 [Strongylocentrotus purpuratus]
MDPQKNYEMNNQRESWCAVELSPLQDWCKSERKHHGENFKSSVFNAKQGQPESEARCTFEVNDKTHREKRHFPNKTSYSHLAI